MLGLNRSIFFSSSSALVQTMTNFLRAMAPCDDLVDLLVQQRLAAGDHHHRRAALVDRLHALGDRQALVQDFGRIVDLAAAGAGQVAAEQRLQHQHQRIALAADQMLLDDIGADTQRLVQRDGHALRIPYVVGEFGGEAEPHVLGHPVQSGDVDLAELAQPLEHALHQHFRRRGAGGDADRADALEPFGAQRVGIVDQVGRLAQFLADFAQAVGVGGVAGADDQDQVDLAAPGRAPPAGGSASRSRCRAHPARRWWGSAPSAPR